jgi:uncharacterized protein YkwD
MKFGLFASSLLALSMIATPVFAQSHKSKLGKTNSTKVESSVVFDASAEEAIVALVNEERAAYGLGPVSVDPRLREAARGHSKDMGDLGFFDHTSPVAGKAKFTDRIKAQGHNKFGAAGENIAMGGFKASARADNFMNMWMNSSGHRANILTEDFQYIGVGVYITSSGEAYATQVFSSLGSTGASPKAPIQTPKWTQPEEVPTPEVIFGGEEESEVYVPSTPAPKRNAPPQSDRDEVYEEDNGLSEIDAQKAKIYWMLEQLSEPGDEENGVQIIITTTKSSKKSTKNKKSTVYYYSTPQPNIYYTPAPKKSGCQ